MSAPLPKEIGRPGAQFASSEDDQNSTNVTEILGPNKPHPSPRSYEQIAPNCRSPPRPCCPFAPKRKSTKGLRRHHPAAHLRPPPRRTLRQRSAVSVAVATKASFFGEERGGGGRGRRPLSICGLGSRPLLRNLEAVQGISSTSLSSQPGCRLEPSSLNLESYTPRTLGSPHTNHGHRPPRDRGQRCLRLPEEKASARVVAGNPLLMPQLDFFSAGVSLFC